jgi:hypothetical protein
MICWTDSNCKGLPATSLALSITEAIWNTQFEPQLPERVRETLPVDSQSMLDYEEELVFGLWVRAMFMVGDFIFKGFRYCLANSYCVRSAN